MTTIEDIKRHLERLEKEYAIIQESLANVEEFIDPTVAELHRQTNEYFRDMEPRIASQIEDAKFEIKHYSLIYGRN